MFGARLAWLMLALAAGCTPLSEGDPHDLSAAADAATDLAEPDLGTDDLAGVDLAATRSAVDLAGTCTPYYAAGQSWCDGFEDATLRTEYTVVQTNGHFMLDGSRSAAGTQSLHLFLDDQKAPNVRLVPTSLSLPTGEMWLRVYAYLPPSPQWEIELFKLDDQRVTVLLGMLKLGGSAVGAVPFGSWFCLTAHVFTDNGSFRYQLRVGDTLLTPMVTGQRGTMPPFIVGDDLNDLMNAYDFWLDELVVSPQDPGCPL